MPLPKYFKPKKKFSLLRLGQNNDGGYLVGKKTVLQSKVLLSLGVSDDWSFEKDFLKINKQTKLLCYDRRPLTKNFFLKEIIKSISIFDFKNVIYNIKKYIDYSNFFRSNKINKRLIRYKSLKKIINDENLNSNVFLKADVEGSEYRILDDILKYQDIICGLVIEFHDIDFHKKDLQNFFEKFKLRFTHVHVNNSAILDLENNPTCLELTFEKNPEIIGEEPEIPHPQDQKNLSNFDDKFINFEE